jgi:DNA repair photolyase
MSKGAELMVEVVELRAEVERLTQHDINQQDEILRLSGLLRVTTADFIEANRRVERLRREIKSFHCNGYCDDCQKTERDEKAELWDWCRENLLLGTKAWRKFYDQLCVNQFDFEAAVKAAKKGGE